MAVSPPEPDEKNRNLLDIIEEERESSEWWQEHRRELKRLDRLDLRFNILSVALAALIGSGLGIAVWLLASLFR